MPTYIFGLIVLVATLCAHLLGLNGYYVEYGWYDIFMHILGGLGIGISLAAFIKQNTHRIIHKRRAIIIGALIAGIIWELFEVIYNIAGYPVGTKLYFLDTLKDLVDDCIGGAFASWLFIKNEPKP